MNSNLSPIVQTIETKLNELALMEDPRREQGLMELVQLVRNCVVDFTNAPAGTYQVQDAVFMEHLRLALQEDRSPELDLLKDKVTRLATLLNHYPWDGYKLSLDIRNQLLTCADKSGARALACSSQQFASIASNPAHLAEVINEGRYCIALNQLPVLLARCGPLVRHLDLSLLLKPDDGARLTMAHLRAMLTHCPQLESLVLFRVNSIQDLPNLLVGTSAGSTLKHITIACCSPLQDATTFPSTVKAACTKVEGVEFGNYSENEYVSNLLAHRISARDALILRRNQTEAKELHKLLKRGLKWSTFQKASSEVQDYLLNFHWQWSDNLPIDAIARLQKTQIKYLFTCTYQCSQLQNMGVDLNLFFQLSDEDQRLYLTSSSCLSVLSHFLRSCGTFRTFLRHPLREEIVKNANELDQILSRGLVTLPEYLQLDDERRALFLANWRTIARCQGVSPQKFLSLELPLFKELMTRGILLLLQENCLMYGMDFDEFCALKSAEDRRHIVTSSWVPTLIARGERLSTILRLSRQELERIAGNPSGFSCDFKPAVPRIPQPQFGQLNLNDAAAVMTFFCSAVSLATGLMTGAVPLPLPAAAIMSPLPPPPAAAASPVRPKQSGGIPLARFVELTDPLRTFVLNYSHIIGEMVRAGLNFEEFLALSPDKQTKLVEAPDTVAKLKQGVPLTDLLK